MGPLQTELLSTLQHPKALKTMGLPALEALCGEIRTFLIDSISKTGGHIGANLGTIELTVALHTVFDSPNDKLFFDTGHQGYTHKLLTGRKGLFATLNQPHGMSRFITMGESEHDIMEATHAGTAISTALGLAASYALDKLPHHVIAIVGDGSLVEGLSFEGLNFGGTGRYPFLLVINDNGMAIAPNVGGIQHLFSGPDWQTKAQAMFEGLGYGYLAVEDGHDLNALLTTFESAKEAMSVRPMVVHVRTTKGKGLSYADSHKYRMHFSMPFHPETGAGASPTLSGETYSVVASNVLYDLMAGDESIVALTPATPYASNLDRILDVFPDRALDVGMAEQHAVSMAAGLALGGKKPVVCFQSTFMQRAMDPILHDLCYMNLGATLLSVRSGFAGYDGPTHHGIYDLSYLQALPNLKLFYAGTRFDVEAILRWRLANPEGPMAILHPYEAVREDETPPAPENRDITQPEYFGSPSETCIITLGNCLGTALKVQKQLQQEGRACSVINLRWIKPFPLEAVLPYLKAAKTLVTVEENIATGGLGATLATVLCDHVLTPRLHRFCLPDGFLRAGNKDELSRETGLTPEAILAALKS